MAHVCCSSKTGIRFLGQRALNEPPTVLSGDIRRPISSHELGFLVRAALPLSDKFHLDLRCVADSRNIGAYALLCAILYTTAGPWGLLFAALLLGALIQYQVQVGEAAAATGDWLSKLSSGI